MDDDYECGTSMPLDEGPEDVNVFKGKDYNDLNDETFGLEDEDFGDEAWELTHEKLAFNFDQQMGRPEEDQGVTSKLMMEGDPSDTDKGPLEEDLEKSITQLVLDDEDDDEMFDIPTKSTSSSQPIKIQFADSNLTNLFGPGSPPSLYDPNLMSQSAKENIWGAAHVEKAKTKSAEDSLKALLHIGGGQGKTGGDSAWTDPSILQAVPGPGRMPAKVMTLEEIEQGVNHEATANSAAQPQPIGTPPRGQNIPMGTPQRGMNQMPGGVPEMVRYWTQKLHQIMGGRVSPTEISKLIVHMHQTSGRISPDYLHQVLIKRASVRSPMVNSPNFAPGTRPNMMPRSPFMPMPYPNQGRVPTHPHQGSPMGRGHAMGISPMGRGYPGTPHPSFGLTPMHPRIPPIRPSTDPGPARRQWIRTPQRGRPDGRYPRPGRDQCQPPGDEYANLMTQREKDWVIRIQMLQLQTENPMISDYYYQIMLQRRQTKLKEGDKGSDEKKSLGDEKFGRGDADERRGKRDGEDKKNKLEPRVYKPAQFEGALGRVTSSSVNNPRQLIDVHSIRHEEEEDASKAKDHGKKRKILLSIERMYDVFLKADDVAIQLNGLPESDTGALLEKRQQLLNDLYKSLQLEEEPTEDCSSHEVLLQILSVRKGRKLLARLLPLLSHQQGSLIVDVVALHLLTVLKRESADIKKGASEGVPQEETLPILFQSMANIINCKTMAEVLGMAKNMTENTPLPQQGLPNVTGAIQHKFGLSVILCALSRAEALFSSTTAKDLDPAIIQEWAQCVDVFANAICEMPNTSIAEPLLKFPQSLEHFKHFVSKQSFTVLEGKLRPITEEEEERPS
ncbi:uncharacterized protein [Apostichopus japonicus]|uniref:uncharacterized protein isoform X2 n=1 Tax=Stichopus japonicus TaxID=307972 RepID=UPI003AB2FEAF